MTAFDDRGPARILAFRPQSQPIVLPLADQDEPACTQCGGPWRDLGHCKGVCLRCGYMQSCVDTL